MRFDRPVVVGAGLAGLTLVDQWTARGTGCTLVERDAAVGGLARSVELGGFPYDLGPHRFFSRDAQVMGYIEGALGDNLRWIERATAIRLAGRLHEWPVNRRIFLSLPPRELVRMGIDLALRSGGPVDNFEDFIVNRYGQTLFRLFFKPMNEKFYRRPCKLIHQAWGRSSVDRAIIDKYPHVDTLSYMISRLVRTQPSLSFAYPRRGGIRALADALVARAGAHGKLDLRTGVSATGFETDGGRVEAVILSDGSKVPADLVVWTGPLGALWTILKGEPSPLEFLSTVFYYYELDPPPARKEQWVYVPDERCRACRVTYQANFYAGGDPAPQGICAEVTARDGEDILARPEDYADGILGELVRIGLVDGAARVTRSRVVAVRETYPVYDVDHEENLERAVREICAVPNLFLAGRGGMFSYNNMDDSLRSSLDAARWLSDARERPDAAEKAGRLLAMRKEC
jgi:protoporphyrinogen oxidase